MTKQNNFSTPTVRGQFVNFSPMISSDEDEQDEEESFVHMNCFRKQINRINDTEISEGDFYNNERLQANPPTREWISEGEMIKKYVDDVMAIEKLCLSQGIITISQGKQKLTLHAENSEDFFKRLRSTLERSGCMSMMTKLNYSATQRPKRLTFLPSSTSVTPE